MPFKDPKKQRHYQLTWVKARAAKHRSMINRYKMVAGCTRCGFNEHPAALDLHHTYGPKEFDPGRHAGRPRVKVLVELRKCEILCSNCHNIEHAKARSANNP